MAATFNGTGYYRNGNSAANMQVSKFTAACWIRPAAVNGIILSYEYPAPTFHKPWGIFIEGAAKVRPHVETITAAESGSPLEKAGVA